MFVLEFLYILYILPLPRNFSKLIILGQLSSGPFVQVHHKFPSKDKKGFLGSFSDVSLGSFRIFFCLKLIFRGGKKISGEFFSAPKKILQALGCSAHTDYGLISLLHQTAPGLQVLHAEDNVSWSKGRFGWLWGLGMVGDLMGLGVIFYFPGVYSMYGISGALALGDFFFSSLTQKLICRLRTDTQS